jgi:hypothetical protein
VTGSLTASLWRKQGYPGGQLLRISAFFIFTEVPDPPTIHSGSKLLKEQIWGELMLSKNCIILRQNSGYGKR